MLVIHESVGKGGKNLPGDVGEVQKALNASPVVKHKLVVDGRYGQRTFQAILQYQLSVFHNDAACDGRIDPHGQTLRSLNNPRLTVSRAVPPTKVQLREQALGGHATASTGAAIVTTGKSGGKLTDADFKAASTALGDKVELVMVRAFAEVESGGKSGFGPAGFPVIAFEGHIFRKWTKKAYDKSHPMLSYAYVEKAGPQWKANNKDQAAAVEVLKKAAALDVAAAYLACSWGMFQVLGENFQNCGFASVETFVEAMQTGERAHLDAFVSFCKKTPGLVTALVAKDFASCARLYNGKDYGDYDHRIRRAYKRYATV